MSWQVAHVITHLELGGAQLATLAQVTRSEFPTGERVLLASPNGALSQPARALSGVRFEPVPALTRAVDPRRDLLALRHIARELRRLERPLLVHTHSPKAGVLGRIAARLAGADLVVHSFHGFGHGRGRAGALFAGVERMSAPLAHGYTVDSQANERQGIRDKVFAGRPVRVVHCGVDTDAFRFDPVARASVRRELGIADDSFLVLTLANFKAQKDPLTFVRVAAEVCARDQRVRFAYAGDGPLRGRVEAELEARGLSSRVQLLGWRRDAARLLSAADLFLLTSRWEGLPQTFGQAMAIGLPIVATRVDGAPEAVDDGRSGFLAPPGDAGALAAAVLRCAGNRDLARRLGEAGQERSSQFSEAAMLAALDGFYRELAAE